MVNDQESTASVNSGKLVLETDLALRIRIGRTFFEPDERYGNAKFSCLQLYDIPMALKEMRELSDRCEQFEQGMDGQPLGLVLMYPFADHHGCHSTTPLAQTQGIGNHDCTLVTGLRARESQAMRVTLADISGDQVLLKPLSSSSSSFVADLSDTSSFTLMLYVRLSTTTGLRNYC